MKKIFMSSVWIITMAMPVLATEAITIGTGGLSGTYYPTGGAICDMMNREKSQTGIECSAKSTGGSAYNINQINNNTFQFGIAQSDTAYQAYRGENGFKDKPVKGLRSVMAIYPELLALVVSKSSGIKSLEDMKNKRINIDVPGSGTRVTVDVVLDAFGVNYSKFKIANEIKSSKGPEMIKASKIDGYFGVFGHPTGNIKELASSTDIDLIPISGKTVDNLVGKYAYYTKGVILGSFYKGIEHDTPSIGVKAVLVTKSSIDERIVYALTKSILDNFETFKKLHPAYSTITKASILEGLSIPQHRGAYKAFKEAGLFKDKKNITNPNQTEGN